MPMQGDGGQSGVRPPPIWRYGPTTDPQPIPLVSAGVGPPPLPPGFFSFQGFGVSIYLVGALGPRNQRPEEGSGSQRPFWRYDGPLLSAMAGPVPPLIGQPGFFAFSLGNAAQQVDSNPYQRQRPFWRYDGPLLSAMAAPQIQVNPDFSWVVIRPRPRTTLRVRRSPAGTIPEQAFMAAPIKGRRQQIRSRRRPAVEIAWFQAAPNAWQVVSSWVVAQRSRFWRVTKRGRIVMPVPPQAAPNAWQVVSTWVVAQRSRFWRVTRRGRIVTPVLPQAAPNPWQVVASFSLIRAVRRYAWRRARMHDEPALMPQQAAVPNPPIVEFARNIRRRMLPSRRGKRFEPAWPQATVPLVFVDWFRRLRRPVGRRPAGSVRVVLGDTPAPVTASRRRPLAALRQRRRLAPVLTQVAAIAPAFVDWVRRRAQRGWTGFRRRLGIFAPPRSTEGRDISLMTGPLGSAWTTTKPDARWLVKSKLPGGAWDISAVRPRWSIITSEVSAWTEPPPRAEDNR